MSNLLSLADAAELCGKSARYLRQLCLEGKIPHAEKIGRDWVIEKQVIEVMFRTKRK